MAHAQTDAQQAFAARMLEKNITPLWTVANRLVRREPTPQIPPVYWSYQRDVRPYILEAADVISAAEAHRRVLVLNNPTLKHGATHTLTCAIQLIKGGEIAPAHRHSQAALRFIIEGDGAYTSVNGERTFMGYPNDAEKAQVLDLYLDRFGVKDELTRRRLQQLLKGELGRLHLVPAHIEELVKAGVKRARLARRVPEFSDFEPSVEATKSIAQAKPG